MCTHCLDDKRNIHTAFLDLCEVPDGCAHTIFSALLALCDQESLDIEHKIAAFRSDGAAVMIGARGGVTTLLKQKSPWLISNHCVWRAG